MRPRRSRNWVVAACAATAIASGRTSTSFPASRATSRGVWAIRPRTSISARPTPWLRRRYVARSAIRGSCSHSYQSAPPTARSNGMFAALVRIGFSLPASDPKRTLKPDGKPWYSPQLFYGVTDQPSSGDWDDE